MELSNLSKYLFFLGIGILFFSFVLFLFSKSSIPLGKLPGDISLKGEKSSFYFPIVSCLLLSIILTIIINLFIYLFRK